MDSVSDEMTLALLRGARRDGIDKLVVGAAIFAPFVIEERILLLRRVADDFMGGLFELPGGGVDEGEKLIAAVAREVEEETGLSGLLPSACVGQFDYTSKSGKTARQFNFLMRAGSTDVTLAREEHSMFLWVSKRSLQATPLPMSSEMRRAVEEAFDAVDGSGRD